MPADGATNTDRPGPAASRAGSAGSIANAARLDRFGRCAEIPSAVAPESGQDRDLAGRTFPPRTWSPYRQAWEQDALESCQRHIRVSLAADDETGVERGYMTDHGCYWMCELSFTDLRDQLSHVFRSPTDEHDVSGGSVRVVAASLMGLLQIRCW